MQDPWGSVHMAVAAWLGCAVPGGFGKGVQAVTEQLGCNWYSLAPKAPCFSHRRPRGTLQPSKPSTLPPASALRSLACLVQPWSQSRHPKPSSFSCQGLPCQAGLEVEGATGVTGLNSNSCLAELGLGASPRAFIRGLGGILFHGPFPEAETLMMCLWPAYFHFFLC